MNLVQPILGTVAAYLLLLFLTRIMGRKVISQMTFFDFVVGVVSGAVAASMAIGPSATTATAAVVLVVLALMTLAFDFLHIKSFSFRKLVNSEPVVIIENGKVNEENMRKVRLTLNDLMMQLRKKEIFNLADMEFAIMETDGELSVLPKSQKKPLTPADIGKPTAYKGLMKDIIIDGNIMEENLQDAHLSRQWLFDELGTQGVAKPEHVFYAGLDTEGKLYVSQKTRTSEQPGKYGIE